MDIQTIHGRIDALSVVQLIAVLKALNNGSVGFDYSKKSKTDLQTTARRYAHNFIVVKGGEEDNAVLMACFDAITEAADNVKTPSKPTLQPIFLNETNSEDDEETKAILAILAKRKNAIDPAQLSELVKTEVEKQVALATSVYRVEIKHANGTVYSDDEKPRHYAFPALLTALSRGLNVMLVGGAGTGKTHAAKDVAKALKAQFYVSGAIPNEFKLLGFLNAQGHYQPTDYRRWFQNGGVMCFDEFDASNPNAVLAVNAGLANGYQDFPDGLIERHESALLVAGCNTWGNGASRQYVGRNQQDAAMCDRWFFLEWNYDEGLESLLYGGRGRSPSQKSDPFTMTAGEWVEYVQAARKAVKKLEIRHVVSMRAAHQGCALVGSDLPRSWVEQGALWKGLPQADVDKIKAEMG